MKKTTLDNKGFSLVELLISAAILSIAVVSVVTIIHKGRDIQLVDMHRQEARAILNTRFETVYIPDRFAVIPIGNSTESITINERDGNPLMGTLNIKVTQNDITASGTTIPALIVTLYMSWDETVNQLESITMTKWVTR